MKTLVDAGPMIALANQSDPDHALCLQTMAALQPPLLTTWATFAEAMHMVGEMGRRAGPGGKWHAQRLLWRLLDSRALEIVEPSAHLLIRMRALMEKYRDTPMDLGDASLVAVAEERQLRRVFTLDSDFLVYRVGRKAFELLPAL